MEEFPIDVGPELFEDERPAIDRDTCNPALISLSKGALRAGVVEARHARGGACSKYFGGVEYFIAASVRVIAIRENEYASRLGKPPLPRVQ
jgi:hypothetical protein